VRLHPGAAAAPWTRARCVPNRFEWLNCLSGVELFRIVLNSNHTAGCESQVARLQALQKILLQKKMTAGLLAASTSSLAGEGVSSVQLLPARWGSPALVRAMNKLRIVILGFGTARQKRVLERSTNPKPLQPI
jgi:hypothetical protein